MKAVAYIRVSTSKQAEKGFSLEAQRQKLQAMALVKDVELIETIIDAGESAKSLDRPGMRRLLELVDGRKIDTVLIIKLDRLTRSVRDLGELLERFSKRGVSLVSLSESLDTGSAAGRMVLNLLTTVSQWEREVIGERTASVLRHKKASRQVYNHVPFGFARQENALVAVEAEQAVIRHMAELKKAGYTLREIAGELNGDGIASKSGGRWYASSVRNCLTSSLNEGLIAV